jgi:glutaminyl-tRNA synthetase
MNAQILAILGPKTEEDLNPKKRKKATKKKTASKSKIAKDDTKAADEEKDDFLAGREIPEAVNTPEQLERRNKAAGNVVVTRFPPEPNGFLHLGHSKAMNFNFGIAAKFDGECNLRFDDTNPSAEDERFFKSIEENVRWLGFKPARITSTSMYFDRLHDLAIEMVKKGLAYVCHQNGDEIKASREAKLPSPYRNRSVAENLKLFEDMRKGKFEEGECSLRLKQDYTSDNPNMWDQIAYRIMYHHHVRSGDKWCIYPSYDFSHCLVDSMENVSYSLCTLEFETRREPYFWLLHQLDMYKPKVWEYSRLNLEFNVMSKRIIRALVESKTVRGWDDPRLLTLDGLRRRGITADAILNFCNRLGVSRSADGTVRLDLLEFCARSELDKICRRSLVVQDPLRVVITNFEADRVDEIKAPWFPKEPEKGSRSMPFSRVVYIERTDFMEEPEKGYRRLAPGRTVHLKYGLIIKCVDMKKDNDGNVVELVAEAEFGADAARIKKEKAHINWVAEPTPGTEPATAELRLYNRLFTDPSPSKDNWADSLNPESEVIVPKAYVEPVVANSKPGDRFQFERLGFFICDKDSAGTKLVFNRTMDLRASKDFK